MSRTRILVVEDNPTARKLFRLMLETEGYAVSEASDARTALESVARDPPALILQDLLLPDMDGLALLAKFRALPQGKELPIVALSGFRSVIEEAKQMPLGFDAALVKPVERSSLLATVRALVPETGRSATVAARGQRVLLVDDDPVQLKLARLRLLEAGYEITTATDAQIALAIATETPPAVILSDVLMPAMDGFELCAAVRKDPKLAGVRVVLMSAHFVDARDEALGRQVGAHSLALRTPHLTEVLEAVGRALNAPPPAPAGDFPRSEHRARLAHRLKQLAALNATLLQRCAQQAAQLSIVGGVAEALSRSENTDAVLQDVLAACLDAGGISKGALFREGLDGIMSPVQSVGFGGPQRDALAAEFRDAGTLALLNAGKAIGLSALLERAERDVFLTQAGVTSAVFVPVMVEGSCLAALFLGCGESELNEEELLTFGRAIGAYVGQALALSGAFNRLSASAEADRILFASLDPDTILQSLSQLVLARMADACEIDVVAEDRTLRRAVSAHADPAKAELLREMSLRYPPRPEGSPLDRVLATQEPYLCVDRTDALRAEIAQDDEHLRMLRAIGLRSHMIVPVVLKGHVLGILSIGTSRPGRRYGKMDLALAQELAGRAAVALERARLYQQANEANRAKDEFLATVSHELRTPLNAMLGWTRMLRAGTLPPEKSKSALASIERNAVAQARLVADILDVSSVVSGKMQLRLSESSFAGIVDTALESVRLSMEAKDLQYVAEIDPTVTLVCDADRMRQVVWNLLSNAVKFTQRGGTIRVSLSSKDDEITLAVMDSGEGIRADFLPRVFERFQQADGSFTRAHGGLGLGLAISRSLVELHGGTIEAASGGPDKGSLFVVKLPRLGTVVAKDPAVSRAARPLTNAASPPKLDGIRCLVVEDDADTQELMLVILADSGAVVSVASSVAEAMTRLSESRHDVLISDVGMPHVDGMTLIRAIRAMPRESGGTIPALAVTGYARAEDKRAALASGFQMHLAKPIEPDDLLAAVARLAREST